MPGIVPEHNSRLATTSDRIRKEKRNLFVNKMLKRTGGGKIDVCCICFSDSFPS